MDIGSNLVAEPREGLMGIPPEIKLGLLSQDLRTPAQSLLQSGCDDESERSCNKLEAMIMHGEGRFQSRPVEVRETILVKCAPSRDTYEGNPCLTWMGSLGVHGRPQMDKNELNLARSMSIASPTSWNMVSWSTATP